MNKLNIMGEYILAIKIPRILIAAVAKPASPSIAQ
jgi:hypothetical protein